MKITLLNGCGRVISIRIVGSKFSKTRSYDADDPHVKMISKASF
jgi:hypothetical protein